MKSFVTFLFILIASSTYRFGKEEETIDCVAATSSMIFNEEHKLSEMLKEVGLELEDFSSENSFNHSLDL